MVLDRLAADVQAVADLRVGQAVAEEGEHLGLPLGQDLAPLGPRARRSSQFPEQGGGGVGVSRRLQPFEGLQSGRGVLQRDRGPLAGHRPGQLQPGLGQLDRHLGPGERREGIVQAGSGVAGVRRHAHLAPGEGRGGLEIRTALSPGQAGEPFRGPGRVVHGTVGQLDVHQQDEEGADVGPEHPLLGQRSLEQVAGQRRPARGKVDGGQRSSAVGMVLEPLEQLGGLLEPTLAHPQIGEAHERGRAHPGIGAFEQAGSLVELELGLVPPTGGGEDPAVMGSTERRHADHVGTGDDLRRPPRPEPRPGPVRTRRTSRRRCPPRRRRRPPPRRTPRPGPGRTAPAPGRRLPVAPAPDRASPEPRTRGLGRGGAAPARVPPEGAVPGARGRFRGAPAWPASTRVRQSHPGPPPAGCRPARPIHC